MFYPVFKVPQLHLKCSHCNHTIIINSYHVSRVMHVAHSANGSISQILEDPLCHQSQHVCGNCTAPSETKIHFSDTHKIYAVDVTNRHVTLSKTVKIQGSACALLFISKVLCIMVATILPIKLLTSPETFDFIMG